MLVIQTRALNCMNIVLKIVNTRLLIPVNSLLETVNAWLNIHSIFTFFIKYFRYSI